MMLAELGEPIKKEQEDMWMAKLDPDQSGMWTDMTAYLLSTLMRDD